MLRKVLLVAVITVVVLFGGLLIAPSFVDWNVYKGQVTNQVNAATGRDLVIDGDLSLTLVPRPTLVASGVRVGNIEGASAPDMIRLRTALVRVALAPLLQGQIAMDSVVLVQPQISLERLADGRVNWSFTPEVEAEGTSTEPAPEDGGFRLPPIAFNNINIEDGTIVFRDARNGDFRRFEKINATVAAGSLQGPFRAAGSLNALGVPFDLRAEIGRLAEDRAIPVSAGIDAGDGDVNAEFSGVLSGFPIEPRLSGQLSGGGSEAASLLGGLLGDGVGDLAEADLALAGELAATPAGVAVTGIELTLGESRATGTVSVALEPDIAANVTLNVSRLDLDALLGEPAADAESGESGQAESAPIQVVPGAQASGGFVFPDSVEISMDATVDAIIYRESIIRQARLAGQLTNGELTISQASAQLPGGADVVLFGFVSTADGSPVFDGQVEASADNLRGLLSWLDVETEQVPADRLRKMELTADIRATPAQLTISNADAQIDLSRVRGGVAVALRERPGLGIGFSIDKLNLDAYVDEPVATPDEPTAPEPTTDEEASNATTGAPPPGLDLSGLSFLDTFDSIIQFQIGSLTYRRMPIQGVNFDGTLQNGELEIRQANIVDLAGSTLNVTGKLTALGTATPAASMAVTLQSEEAAPLFDALGLGSPSSGPVKLAANVTGNASEFTLDTNLLLQGLTLQAGGRIADLVTNPSYDLQLEVSHDSTATLLGMLTNAAGADLGAVQIDGRVQGDLATANLELKGQFGPGELNISGDLADLRDNPAADLQLDVAYPDLQRLIRAFRPDYRAALTELGEFRLASAARYEPAGVTLSGLQGAIGPVALQGEASLTLDGDRPRLVANLSTSEIIADWFLAPVAAVGSSAPGSADAETGSPGAQQNVSRWSSDPLDLAWLRAFDAELTVDTPGLSYANYSVAQPQVMLSLNDGQLQLERLAGKAFDGDFSMSAEIDAQEKAAAKILVSVVGADAAKLTEAAQSGRQSTGESDVVGGVLELLFPVSAVKLQSGTIGAELAFEAAGASELELVSNLNGSGELTFSNAVIDGFDICRLSAQLGDINGVESILGLALTADGGTTTINDFVGRFDVVDGIADLPRQQLDAQCALAEISGKIDLPRWFVDLGADLTFPEHPEFPGIEIEERGSLDAPNVRLVNLNEVQQYFVGRAAEGLLRDLIPDDVVEPAPAPAVEQPATAEVPAPEQPAASETPATPEPAVEAPEQAPESPADPFIKLLDTLIKNR